MEHVCMLENFMRMSSQTIRPFPTYGTQQIITLFPKAHHCPLSWSRLVHSTFLTDKLNWSPKFWSASHDVRGFLRATLCILVDNCFQRLDGACCTHLQCRSASRGKKMRSICKTISDRDRNREPIDLSRRCRLFARS